VLPQPSEVVSEGLLQEKNLVNWRPSFREPFPMENVDEIITFFHFAERGLALPTCSFFRGLLYYYGIEHDFIWQLLCAHARRVSGACILEAQATALLDGLDTVP
jgi:hypothetical protein